MHTIVPGAQMQVPQDGTSPIHLGRSRQQTMPGVAVPPGVPAWLPWALEQAPRYLPALAGAVGGPVAAVRVGGPWPHIVLLWITVAALVLGGTMHLLSDGTLRAQVEATAAKVDRTDCDVRWLVRRALAEDRGQPVPPYSPEDCESR